MASAGELHFCDGYLRPESSQYPTMIRDAKIAKTAAIMKIAI
jgi:hypothetical protein